MSLLDWSAGLFVAYGFVWLAIGLLAFALMDRGVGEPLLVFSNRTDARVFGATPQEMLRDERVRLFRSIMWHIAAGFLTCAGLLVMAVAWFALRTGERWALWALTIVPLVAIASWLRAARPYMRPGVRVRLGDVPPFMWVPTVLAAPAIALGWIALA